MYNPLSVVTFIRDMLREMYLEYGGEDLAWSDDPRKSKIVIETANNIHSDSRAQQFPRILIQRGTTVLGSQFINNNFTSTKNNTVGIAAGDTEYYRQDINGSLNILIEARQEGTCEELGELTRRFICWSKPFIERRFGFQAFAKQMQLSQCDMDQEDNEKFKININIPYIIEDVWKMRGDLVRLNHVFQRLEGNPDPTIIR